MRTSRRRVVTAAALAGILLVTLTTTAVADQGAWATTTEPVPVPLDGHFDNDGIDTATARDGNFDGTGRTYPAERLPAPGLTVVNGVPYVFPAATAGAKNNVVAMGQRIELTRGRYHGAHLLLAATTPEPTAGVASGPATVHYADGGTSTAALTMGDWLNAGGVLTAPQNYGPDNTVNEYPVSIFTTQLALDPNRTAVAITLPVTSPVAADKYSLHVFSMSVQPAVPGKSLAVRAARSTTKVMSDKAGAQAFEATVVNVGQSWITEADRVVVTVDVPGAVTVTPAAIRRLAPGEEVRVRVGVRRMPLTRPGTEVDGSVRVRGTSVRAEQKARFTLGTPTYQATDESLARHQSPYWYDDAKFGFFVMYGPYSVPSYAPLGRLWAEWYWAIMTDGPALMGEMDVNRHHEQTYGKDFRYDDFIGEFTADKFDAAAWVKLFEESGARYYVFSAKQHDGFAMYNSAVSGRDSVDLGPKRDFVKELAEAARVHTPGLRSGAYFSMQEWYNPDLPWIGHGPKDAFTGEDIPYTGYQTGRDFVRDYQSPQIKELFSRYPDLDLLWCDILGPNDSRAVQAELFNAERRRGQQLAVNDQCGLSTSDFTTTPQMMYGNTVVKKWERSQTIEPTSYGYNQQTPAEAYKSPNEIVDMLVDVVSKNGNLLLTAAPQGDGTFPPVMQERMRAVGDWLDVNGEAIYGTTYWARMPALGNLRFTVKPNEAFYITSLDAPGDKVVVDAPVPVKAGDRVTLLGYPGGPLAWSKQGGKLVIEVPPAARRAGAHAWTFKIS